MTTSQITTSNVKARAAGSRALEDCGKKSTLIADFVSKARARRKT